MLAFRIMVGLANLPNLGNTCYPEETDFVFVHAVYNA